MSKKTKPASLIGTSFLLLSMSCFSFVSFCAWFVIWCSQSNGTKEISFFALLLTIGLLALLWQSWRSKRALQRLMRYAQVAPPLPLLAEISDWGIKPSDFVLIESREAVAFCFGFLRPRICLSTGFVALLSKSQLRAAISHEDYHRQNFDPLRILLLEALSKALFFLPIVQEYVKLYTIHLELAADRYAVERAGKAALAGALHRLLNQASSPKASYGIIAGISANSARIAALLGDRSPYHGISLRSLLISSLIIWLFCLALMY